MSQGGKAKRIRTTRAAYSAMEGGQRSTTRAERWFKANINSHMVLATGGKDWPRACGEDSQTSGRNRNEKVLDEDSCGEGRVQDVDDSDELA